MAFRVKPDESTLKGTDLTVPNGPG